MEIHQEYYYMTTIVLKPEFYNLMTESKKLKDRRNKKQKLLRIEYEKELIPSSTFYFTNPL